MPNRSKHRGLRIAKRASAQGRASAAVKPEHAPPDGISRQETSCSLVEQGSGALPLSPGRRPRCGLQNERTHARRALPPVDRSLRQKRTERTSACVARSTRTFKGSLSVKIPVVPQTRSSGGHWEGEQKRDGRERMQPHIPLLSGPQPQEECIDVFPQVHTLLGKNLSRRKYIL